MNTLPPGQVLFLGPREMYLETDRKQTRRNIVQSHHDDDTNTFRFLVS